MKRRPLTAIVAVAIALGVFAGPVAASPFPTRITLPPGWMPEGIAAGPGTTIYVGSLAGGEVWAGDVRTGEGDVLVPPWGGAAVGLKYEADANRLWVAGGPTATVRVYDASSGELLRQYTFATATPSFINDLVVTGHCRLRHRLVARVAQRDFRPWAPTEHCRTKDPRRHCR